MLTLHIPPSFSAAREYAAKVIFEAHLGLDVRFTCGTKNEWRLTDADGARSLLMPDVFFAEAKEQWLKASSLPCPPFPAWHVSADIPEAVCLEAALPVIAGAPNGQGAWYTADSPAKSFLGLDVFGAAFLMLSRYEECVLPDRDAHDRFPSTASVAYKAGFLNRPIVDEYVEILWAAMHRVWPGLRRKKNIFQMRVSHDVDVPSLSAFHSWGTVARQTAGALIKRRNGSEAWRVPWVKCATRSRLISSDPFNTFDWLMDQSDRHGLRSAFYFLAGQTDLARDAHYDVGHPAIRNLMHRIHERGHEVGLHPSYNSYRNSDAMQAEAWRFRQVCREEGIEQAEWGGRMHYLRWAHPTTLYGWVRAGMDYDATLGYADRPGFRCGTCFEYPAFDPVAGQPVPVRIRPLIAMECTVMAERYMGLETGADALRILLELKEACRRVGGAFTLLWHNTEVAHEDQRKLYEAVLA